MSEKIFRVVIILFLSSIFVLSCSNKDKTGDGTQTVQGIAKYAGTWTAKFSDNISYSVIINTDGKVTIDDGSKDPKQATDIKKEAENKYTMTVQHSSSGIEASTVTITFDNETSGTINDTSDFHGAGVIRKQNGGNKGLWYYEGTWILTPTQKQGEANMTMEIKKDGTIDLKIGNQTQLITDIVDKGKEKYEGKFTPEGEQDQQTLTLSFSVDDTDTGTFSLSIPNKDVINGSMEKQKQQK